MEAHGIPILSMRRHLTCFNTGRLVVVAWLIFQPEKLDFSRPSITSMAINHEPGAMAYTHGHLISSADEHGSTVFLDQRHLLACWTIRFYIVGGLAWITLKSGSTGSRRKQRMAAISNAYHFCIVPILTGTAAV